MKMRAPIWFVILVVVEALAALMVSFEAARIMSDSGWLSSDSTGWLYPAFVIIAAACALISYPTRKPIAWLLVAILALTIAGLFAVRILV